MEKTNNLYCTTASQYYYWKPNFRSRIIKAWLLGLLSILGCVQGALIQENNNITSSSKIRPIDIDTSTAERIGQEVLDKIGYDEIIKLSERAGFVKYRSNISIQLVSYESVATTDFAPVFSRYALAAAVTSQADSPLPGPADIAAVGVIVIGLVDAGLLDGYLIKSIGKLIVAAGESTLPATVATDVPDYRSDCRAYLMKCMETSPSRGRPGSGSHPGKSICADCFDRCNGQRSWPDKTYDGKDCQWWDGR